MCRWQTRCDSCHSRTPIFPGSCCWFLFRVSVLHVLLNLVLSCMISTYVQVWKGVYISLCVYVYDLCICFVFTYLYVCMYLIYIRSHISMLWAITPVFSICMLQCVAMCCNVLQCALPIRHMWRDFWNETHCSPVWHDSCIFDMTWLLEWDALFTSFMCGMCGMTPV